MNHLLKSVFLSLLLGNHLMQGQYELEIIEKYSNSYQNKEPKSEIYLVIGFSENFGKYFFDAHDSCLLVIKKMVGEGMHKRLGKKDFFKNSKNGLLEYYYLVSHANKIKDAGLFDLYLASVDSSNFTKVSFTEKDKSTLAKAYDVPDDNASSKEKLKYYKKTGDRQGQLMGQAKIIEIKKRMKCSAKKRKYRKEGINGTKEMIYGF